MPRRDRTFTECDLVRFIFANLDEVEISRVTKMLDLYADVVAVEEPSFFGKLIDFMQDVIEAADNTLEESLADLFREQAERYKELNEGQQFVVDFVDRCKFKKHRTLILRRYGI